LTMTQLTMSTMRGHRVTLVDTSETAACGRQRTSPSGVLLVETSVIVRSSFIMRLPHTRDGWTCGSLKDGGPLTAVGIEIVRCRPSLESKLPQWPLMVEHGVPRGVLGDLFSER
jgi:hypothetical protein